MTMRSDISINQELFEIYQRNFPFIERNEDTVRWILGNADNRVIEERNALRRLIGAAVVNQNTLLLLCVDAEYRNRGIGTGLLEGAEQAVRDSGFGTIAVGAGFDYITPGVPTSRSRFDSENEELYPELDRAADDFFTKRGYVHAWDCNCFDMRCDLTSWRGRCRHLPDEAPRIADGVTYRFAEPEEVENVCACVDDAWSDFTGYYRQEALYHADSPSRVLIAVRQGSRNWQSGSIEQGSQDRQDRSIEQRNQKQQRVLVEHGSQNWQDVPAEQGSQGEKDVQSAPAGQGDRNRGDGKASGEVAGTLIVTIEDKKRKLGSIGCTTVRPAFRGQHIAVGLVMEANRYLKEAGMKEAYLSYTYSGLDHMYGYAGYRICVYYMMAQKKL